MSCVIIPEKQINSIVNFMKNSKSFNLFHSGFDFDKFRIKMMSVNQRAFMQRYSHSEHQFDLCYDTKISTYKELNQFEFIKFVRSYLYQIEDLTQTSDRQEVERLLEAAVINSYDDLKEYAEIDWIMK